jgi:hypothetical protein
VSTSLLCAMVRCAKRQVSCHGRESKQDDNGEPRINNVGSGADDVSLEHVPESVIVGSETLTHYPLNNRAAAWSEATGIAQTACFWVMHWAGDRL